METHTAELVWCRENQNFLDGRYSRKHLWRFDGGLEIPASSSPHVVPPPMSDEASVDPEEAFTASLSSCHMLWFLSIAAKNGYCVDQYYDSATAVMKKNKDGKLAIALVTLRPQVHFSGELMPTWTQVLTMHDKAHEECFIANSVKSEVRCEPEQPAL